MVRAAQRVGLWLGFGAATALCLGLPALVGWIISSLGAPLMVSVFSAWGSMAILYAGVLAASDRKPENIDYHLLLATSPIAVPPIVVACWRLARIWSGRSERAS